MKRRPASIPLERSFQHGANNLQEHDHDEGNLPSGLINDTTATNTSYNSLTDDTNNENSASNEPLLSQNTFHGTENVSPQPSTDENRQDNTSGRPPITAFFATMLDGLVSAVRYVFSANLFCNPVFLTFVIVISLSVLSVMYFMRSLLFFQPNQSIPEFIPQAAIITVPDTNDTLAARPAAFGPRFPEASGKFWVKENGSSINILSESDTNSTQSLVIHKSFEPVGGQTDSGGKQNKEKRSVDEDDDADSLFDTDDMLGYAKEYKSLYDKVFKDKETVDADEENMDDFDDYDSSLYGLLSYIYGNKLSWLSSDSDGFTGVLGIVDGFACSDTGFEGYDISETITQYSMSSNKSGTSTGSDTSLNVFDSTDGRNFQQVVDLPFDNSTYANIRGKIAMVERGECSFYQKVMTLQRHGAIAVIVADNIYRRGLITMYSTVEPDMAKIPSVFVSKDSYDVLKAVVDNWKDKKVVGPAPSAKYSDSSADSFDSSGLDGPLITISTIHATGPVMGPVLFLLVSPLFSLSVIYGIMIFHRQYKKVQERAPKWVVDSLPRRLWVDPALRHAHDGNADQDVLLGQGASELEEGSDRGKTLALLEEGDAYLENQRIGLHKAGNGYDSDSESLNEGNERDGLLPPKSKCKGKKETESGSSKPLKEDALSVTNLNGDENRIGTVPVNTDQPDDIPKQIEWANKDSQQPAEASSLPHPPTSVSGTDEGRHDLDPYEKVWVSSGECIICLEDYESGVSVVVRLPCGHEFHEDCICKWLLSRKKTCPICKMDITEHIEQKMGLVERWKIKFWEWAKDLRSHRTRTADEQS